MPSSSSSVPSTTHFFIFADLAHALRYRARAPTTSSGPGPTAPTGRHAGDTREAASASLRFSMKNRQL